MRRSETEKWLTRLGIVLSLLAILLVLFGCTRTFVPSGRPGCPNATVWSDSAQKCVAADSTEALEPSCPPSQRDARGYCLLRSDSAQRCIARDGR